MKYYLKDGRSEGAAIFRLLKVQFSSENSLQNEIWCITRQKKHKSYKNSVFLDKEYTKNIKKVYFLTMTTLST